MLRLMLITVTAMLSTQLLAKESAQWTAQTKFSIEGANYIQTLTFVSGISYALTESAKELSKQNKQNFFCYLGSQPVSSELLISILNSKHSGEISAETAISTITHELAARYPCANTAYNNTLNVAHFVRRTSKSYAFVRPLA